MFLLNLLFSVIISFNLFCDSEIKGVFTGEGISEKSSTNGLAKDVLIGGGSSRSSSSSSSNKNPFSKSKASRKSSKHSGTVSTFGGRGSGGSVSNEKKARGYVFSNNIVDDVKTAFESVGILSSSSSGFIWPAQKGYISSYYGWRTSTRFHDGIDIAAPTGTKIYASKGGKVKYSANKISGYGKMVVIKHNDTYSSVYAHNSRNLVKKGDYVKQGQVIALMGSTGHSTGPHLHFEIRKGKYSQDPLKHVKKPRKRRRR
jgi:murein DD-endopeptidase MepM/ murein hydrolase activator NlpD